MLFNFQHDPLRQNWSMYRFLLECSTVIMNQNFTSKYFEILYLDLNLSVDLKYLLKLCVEFEDLNLLQIILCCVNFS